MAKTEHQIRFITRLGEFTGRVPAVYTDQKEFFISSLRSMSEHLVDLKRETLNEACAAFGSKLDRGTVTDKTIAEFEDLLEKLVSEKDFAMACANMIGSKELIKKRLAALVPLSLIDEEKRTEGKDLQADRHIRETYARLNFGALVKELNAEPGGRAVETVLRKAREEVADYCCLYHIPLDESDTFTPYTLLHVDAMIAASYRILSDIRKNIDFRNPGGKLILVADDDEAVMELLVFLARKEGFRTETAADGVEALKKAKGLRPDLILLDLMLPKYSGFEILRELQGDDTSDIPIIILTGHPTDRSTSEMIEREPNVKDFMQKPVKHQVLAALLHKHVKAPVVMPTRPNNPPPRT